MKKERVFSIRVVVITANQRRLFWYRSFTCRNERETFAGHVCHVIVGVALEFGPLSTRGNAYSNQILFLSLTILAINQTPYGNHTWIIVLLLQYRNISVGHLDMLIHEQQKIAVSKIRAFSIALQCTVQFLSKKLRCCFADHPETEALLHIQDAPQPSHCKQIPTTQKDITRCLSTAT